MKPNGRAYKSLFSNCLYSIHLLKIEVKVKGMIEGEGRYEDLGRC